MKRIEDKRIIRYIDNYGISLVELIVTISIMIILTGAISIGIGLISTRPATECAKKIQMSLSRCRTTTMGKQEGNIKFYLDGSDVYAVETYDGVSKDPVKIGKSIDEFTFNGESEGTVFFSRSDGSVDKDAMGANYPFTIIVRKGSRKYTITIPDYLTGKVRLE